MKCTATAKTTGKRCQRGAIHGGNVCKKHGGAAPQVKRKAAQRLRALVHPAIDRLEKMIADDENPTQALAAARDVLDRVPETSKHQKIDLGGEVKTGDPGRNVLTDEVLAKLIAIGRQLVAARGDSEQSGAEGDNK